jgi:hypothetical protein
MILMSWRLGMRGRSNLLDVGSWGRRLEGLLRRSRLWDWVDVGIDPKSLVIQPGITMLNLTKESLCVLPKRRCNLQSPNLSLHH